MGYREHPPPAQLTPWVACTWEREADGGPPVRVVPDGCIDIVWTEGRGTHVVGPNTTAFFVALVAGTRVAGVRFRPGAAPGVLGLPAPALRDARVGAAEVLADAGRRLSAALDEREDRVGTLAAFVRGRVRGADDPDPLVGTAVARLADPDLTVTGLARELYVSERQLRRRVEAAVGYGPKRLARVLRLGRALSAARSGEELGRVAFDAGYADQAHFANECRGLAGAAPTALLAA